VLHFSVGVIGGGSSITAIAASVALTMQRARRSNAAPGSAIGVEIAIAGRGGARDRPSGIGQQLSETEHGRAALVHGENPAFIRSRARHAESSGRRSPSIRRAAKTKTSERNRS
jgi:hypothetical protein